MSHIQYLRAMYRVYRVNHGPLRAEFMALRDALKPLPF